jgi:hypothetical protein
MTQVEVPLTMTKKHGPPSRANERLSNLILEGGKSQSYPKDRSTRKDAPTQEAHTPGENGTGRTQKT